jgi:uncharacterized protein (TIGR02186 family)
MKGLGLIFLMLVTGLAMGTRAQTLTADLSSHVIGINTYFAGADLVLFGSTDKRGDVVVIVRGQPTDMVVRRKERIAGLWLNGTSVTFHDAPSFYAVASSRPLTDIASQGTLARNGIGLENIRLQPAKPVPDPTLATFRSAFVSNQEDADFYRPAPTRVTFQGEHLFRADMSFPATVPTGNYTVEVFLFVDGEVIGAQTTPLVVSRIGFSNGVYAVANRNAALYGAGGLLFAVFAGWAAGAIFRRV